MTALFAWITFLAVAIVGLHASPVPPGDGVTTAFAGVRIVALALAWYLLLVTLLALVARSLRVARAVRWADAITVPVVRHLVNRAAGLALAASLVAPASPVAAAGPPPAAVTAPATTDVPVMRLLEDAPAVPAAPAAPPVAETHVVAPGDSLWSVASDVLEQRFGRPPRDSEIVPYWNLVIEANAETFPDPNLIFAGQIVSLP